MVTALFTAFEVYANHVQMTYYYLFIIFFMIVAFFVQALKEKQMARFFKASPMNGLPEPPQSATFWILRPVKAE